MKTFWSLLMDNIQSVLQRYYKSVDLYGNACAQDPSVWHRPDTSEFSQLHDLLLPFAKADDMYAQYALATIYWLGLSCKSEEQYFEEYQTLIEKATFWWVAAASQGHWIALDNLLTCGVGEEAERVQNIRDQFEKTHLHLVDRSHDMPLYGPDFMQELCRTVYGKVIEDLSLNSDEECNSSIPS